MAAEEDPLPELSMEGGPTDVEWIRIGVRNRMVIGHTPEWDVHEVMARYEAAVIRDYEAKRKGGA